MALVIRLRRQGARKRPFFRIVVAESTSPRDGRCVAQIGTYDPACDPPKVNLRTDQVERWLKAGARPTPTVANLLDRMRQPATA
jgi:small subunit ribosomal protein S16